MYISKAFSMGMYNILMRQFTKTNAVLCPEWPCQKGPKGRWLHINWYFHSSVGTAQQGRARRIATPHQRGLFIFLVIPEPRACFALVANDNSSPDRKWWWWRQKRRLCMRPRELGIECVRGRGRGNWGWKEKMQAREYIRVKNTIFLISSHSENPDGLLSNQ